MNFTTTCLLLAFLNFFLDLVPPIKLIFRKGSVFAGLYRFRLYEDSNNEAPLFKTMFGEFLGVQWLIQCFHCHGPDSIPGRGTKIPQAAWRGQKKKIFFEGYFKANIIIEVKLQGKCLNSSQEQCSHILEAYIYLLVSSCHTSYKTVPAYLLRILEHKIGILTGITYVLSITLLRNGGRKFSF